MRKSLFSTLLIATGLFSTITFAQQSAILVSSRSGVGMGRVEIGNSSRPLKVEISVTSQSPASPPGATTADVNYGRYSFHGPNRKEFNVWPPAFRPISIKEGGPSHLMYFKCSPLALGRRIADFYPTVIGARNTPKYFPLRLSCIGIGKTLNEPNNPLKIYNGSGTRDGAREFRKILLGTTAKGQITVKNPGTEKYDIRIQWVLGPRRDGGFNLGSNAIKMKNPASYLTAQTYKLGPGSSVPIPITFTPMYKGLYDAALEVRFDKTGTTNRPSFLYTYITGEGTKE